MRYVSEKWWAPSDRFQISTTDGARRVERWIIKELLKAHQWVTDFMESGEDLGPV